MGWDDTHKLSLYKWLESLITYNVLPYERHALLKDLHSIKSDLSKGFTNTHLECYLVKGFTNLLRIYNIDAKPTYHHRISILLIQWLESIVECLDLMTCNLELLIPYPCSAQSHLILPNLICLYL